MITLAALLHDIGRLDATGEKTDEAWIELLAQKVCEKVVGVPDWHELSRLAAAHLHQDDKLDDMQRILVEAHRLSLAGTDHAQAVKNDGAALISICSYVQADKPMGSRYINPIPLTLSRDCYPSDQRMPYKENRMGCVLAALEKLQPSSAGCIADTLYSVLLTEASMVSCTRCDNHVSLFDHLHTTAAIASALYATQEGCRDAEKPLLLIGGDMSGIQPYIMQIISKHADKNLKGRSYYIKLVSDVIVKLILQRLGLRQSNIIYNSGGCFYLLAANTEATHGVLERTIDEVEQQLFHYHGTMLYAAIDCVAMPLQVLASNDGALRGYWKSLFELRDRKKYTKFARLISNNYDAFFEPSARGAEALRDSVTGEEIPADETPIKKGGLVMRGITEFQIELGKTLRDTQYVVMADKKAVNCDEILQYEPLGLGYIYYFVRDTAALEKLLDALPGRKEVLTFNDLEPIHQPCVAETTYRRGFYGGNEYGEHGTHFELMAGDGNLKRLGVLRMDVDNLGHIFQSGLSDNINSLSAMAALSRALDQFFSGCLNHIWRGVDKDNSFIVYSGGDDLFVIGRWDVASKLAYKIKEQFDLYTGHNPAFSISGGLAIVEKWHPVMRGSEESGEMEDLAKSHTSVGQTKHSLALLDMAINWDNEYPAVEALKDQICRLVQDDRMPSAFMGKILAHYGNARIKHHEITQLKTLWMIAYDMTRMKGRMGEDIECKELIETCKNETSSRSATTLGGRKIKSDYHPLELWALAARWAELEIRTNNQ